MSLKNKILGVACALKKVSVPELDTDVYIRRMNGLERCEYQAAQFAAAREGDAKGPVAYQPLQPLLLSLTLCDEKGARLFSKPEEMQTIDALVLERLNDISMEFNVLTQESRDALEKKATPSGSGTTSPTSSESQK